MKPISRFKFNQAESPVYKYGQGEAVILVLHGWGSSINSWHSLLTKIDPALYTSYFLELPGFGSSAKPIKAWKVDDYANLVRAFMDSLDVKPEYLLVHSFGGRLALKLLLDKQQSIKKAIFVGAAGIKPQLSKFQKLSQKIAPYFKKVKHNKYFARPYRFLQKILYKMLGAGDYLKVEGVMRKTFLNVIEEDLSPNLEKVCIPVRLVWGDQDSYTPLWMGNLMHQKIKNSELIVIEDGKHGLHLQNPEIIVQNIHEFFS